jgi:hypothetical protein
MRSPLLVGDTVDLLVERRTVYDHPGYNPAERTSAKRFVVTAVQPDAYLLKATWASGKERIRRTFRMTGWDDPSRMPRLSSRTVGRPIVYYVVNVLAIR